MANPNPDTSGLKPFKKGQSGNPGGVSSETARLIRENAEAAARVRARAFKAIEAKLSDMEHADDDAIAMLVDATMLKLLKDSEDRGLGAPVQEVNQKTFTVTISGDDKEI